MCPGFEAAGIAAGLKKKNKKDLGLIFSKVPAMLPVCLHGTG
jgi:N-acetylglutamate synthase/N-acetylornithine aminotransferase